jgi:hypothetical protein
MIIHRVRHQPGMTLDQTLSFSPITLLYRSISSLQYAYVHMRFREMGRHQRQRHDGSLIEDG